MSAIEGLDPLVWEHHVQEWSSRKPNSWSELRLLEQRKDLTSVAVMDSMTSYNWKWAIRCVIKRRARRWLRVEELSKPCVELALDAIGRVFGEKGRLPDCLWTIFIFYINSCSLGVHLLASSYWKTKFESHHFQFWFGASAGSFRGLCRLS